jgi:5,10-methylenetetrahydrofolate reductase|uniref:Methylenetetrahydrofolate reductase (NAD(P)H) n=1 Tax=Ignisphaera aggregans TaxID=334771 RepID=A0A7J2U4D3_9CREN
MKVLHEFVPTRKFLKMAEETKDLVDGWNITDSAAGVPAPSGTAVGCVLKTRYPDKIVIPIFILNYKGPVEVGALALAADAVGLDGIVMTMGDEPVYGEPLGPKYWGKTESARDFLREKVKIKALKLGCLLSPRPVRERYGEKTKAGFTAQDMIERVKSGWDFAFFARLTPETLPVLEEVSKEIKKVGKPLYTYFLIETPRNKEILKKIGWSPTTTIDKAVEFAEKLENLVDGIIATCAGDYQGDLELLKALQRIRKK